MADNFSIKVIGYQSVIKNFALASEVSVKRMQQVVAQVASEVRDGAKRIVPVDTGTLRNSITVKSQENTSTGASAEIGPNTTYESYVEFGTSKMRAQPYMRPASLEAEGSMERKLGKIIE